MSAAYSGDYIHIGNARPYVTFDTVRRYLEYKGLKLLIYKILPTLTINN